MKKYILKLAPGVLVEEPHRYISLVDRNNIIFYIERKDYIYKDSWQHIFILQGRCFVVESETIENRILNENGKWCSQYFLINPRFVRSIN